MNTLQELDQLLEQAYASHGQQEDINKFYLGLLRTSLYVPVHKINKVEPHQAVQDTAESYLPLYHYHKEIPCMLAFTSHERLKNWAKEHLEQMDYVVITGEEFIDALGNEVHLHFNIGTEFYKEFVAEEIKSLKKLSGRLKLLRGSA